MNNKNFNNYSKVKNNLLNIKLKIYMFFIFLFVGTFISIYSYKYIMHNINKLSVNAQNLNYNDLDTNSIDSIFEHYKLIEDHHLLRKSREHYELTNLIKKTPKEKILHEFYKKGYECVGCPTEKLIKETDNKYIKEKKLIKTREIKELKLNDDDDSSTNKKIKIEEKTNITDQYNVIKEYIKENNDNLFKDFDNKINDLLTFTLLNDIPYLILEFNPGSFKHNHNLVENYIMDNYLKMNIHDNDFEIFIKNLNFNIIKYHLCEKYTEDEKIKINQINCINSSVFLFENGELSSIISY